MGSGRRGRQVQGDHHRYHDQDLHHGGTRAMPRAARRRHLPLGRADGRCPRLGRRWPAARRPAVLRGQPDAHDSGPQSVRAARQHGRPAGSDRLPASGSAEPDEPNLGSSYRFPSLMWAPVTWIDHYNVYIGRAGSGSGVDAPRRLRVAGRRRHRQHLPRPRDLQVVRRGRSRIDGTRPHRQHQHLHDPGVCPTSRSRPTRPRSPATP